MTCPVGCPLASSQARENPLGSAVSGVLSGKQDPRSSSRLTSPRVAQLARRLSSRDREVLEIVERFRVMSAKQLRRLYWPEGSAGPRARVARRVLARLCELEVLAPLARRVGGVRAGSDGTTLAVGLAGQRLLASRHPEREARRPHVPGERYLAHTLAVAEIYVELVEAQRRGRGELLAFDPEPACWRRYPGPYGAQLVLKPDAHVRLGVGEFELAWLLEVDLATETPVTIVRKARRHLDYYRSGVERRSTGISPRVAWIAPDEQRAAAIRLALGTLRVETHQLFVVATFADAVATLTAQAPS